MNTEYHKWWSPSLNQEMELKIYGDSGKPVLVFPAQGGRFYEFEDFGMVKACHWFIDEGKIKLFTVDSVDNQSWANSKAHPVDRARRHEDYYKYIIREIVPFIAEHCDGDKRKLLTTGVSMGGYHAGNFFFRHPDIFDSVLTLSGLFQLRSFIGNYMDDNVYFNSPLDYLTNLIDSWYLDQYRKSHIIICVGQGAWEKEMVADAQAMKKVLLEKNIPCWVDFWGPDASHDWPWWRKQLPYFLSHLASQQVL